MIISAILTKLCLGFFFLKSDKKSEIVRLSVIKIRLNAKSQIFIKNLKINKKIKEKKPRGLLFEDL